MLKIPPHPSFLTPSNGEQAIIFNPPSAAPNVYHTPFKFLPKTDPRRQSNLTHLLGVSADSHRLPPAATKTSEIQPKRNVSLEEVDEMRRLRLEDPRTWSVTALAKKFDCTKYFVMMCCKSSDDHRQSEKARLEAIKARWGPIRKKAREERQKRKVLLAKGEL